MVYNECFFCFESSSTLFCFVFYNDQLWPKYSKITDSLSQNTTWHDIRWCVVTWRDISCCNMKCKTWLDKRWRDVGWRDRTCFDVADDTTLHRIAFGMSKRNKLCTQQCVVKVIVEGGVEMERSVNVLKSKRIALAWKQNVPWLGLTWLWVTWLVFDMAQHKTCRNFFNGSKHVVLPWDNLCGVLWTGANPNLLWEYVAAKKYGLAEEFRQNLWPEFHEVNMAPEKAIRTLISS